MNLGIDIGNQLGKTSEGIIFDARVSQLEPFMTECDVLEMNDKIYYIEQGQYEHKNIKFEKTNYIPLLVAAICKSSDKVNNNIVIGLPISQFKTHGDSLKKLIDENSTLKVVWNGKTRNLIIEKFDVYPEGVAIFNSLDEKMKQQIDKKDVLLVDIGSRTTDCCIFKYKNEGSRGLEKPNSLFVGTHNVYKEVRNAINTKYNTRKTLEEVIEMFETRVLLINGEQKDMSFINDVIISELNKIINDLELEYDLASHQILLCGGGATMMYGSFVERYSSTILVSDIFANAKGYKIIADARF